MAAKKKKVKFTQEQIAAADQEWARLEQQLASEMSILEPARLQVGRILYQMKLWLKKWGLNKGRRGRWTALLRKYPSLKESTVRGWIQDWQEYANIPDDKLVFERKKTGNPADSNGFFSQSNSENQTVRPEIVEAKDDQGDNSADRRMAVECIFALTMEEKHKFMEAVKRLGSLEATQRMYKAVVE